MSKDHPWDDAPSEREPVFLNLDQLDPQSVTGRKALDAAHKRKKRGKTKKPKGSRDSEPKDAVIARVPPVAPPATGDEAKRGVSDRARAAANLAVDLVPYDEIALICGYTDARAAERAVLSVLSVLHPPEDYETLQLKARAQAAKRLRVTSQMADAEYLVDDKTGDRIPNADRLRWASQASTDLMNWVTIAGAKAPTKVEITPGDEQMKQILDIILERSGVEEIMDADVIDLEIERDEIEVDEDGDATILEIER